MPGARLHLTHLSTAGALDLVRRAKAAGLPVTCDVTPHHLALTDEWLAGRAALGVGGERRPVGGRARSSRRRTTRRCASTRRCARPRTRRPAWRRSLDGTADAIATDHAPHTEVDKAVEFGLAANGISGLETALGVVLAAVDAGRLPLLRAIEALTTGPAGVLGGRSRRDGSVGLVEGAPADLVVFDRSERWTVTAGGARVARQEHAAARDGAGRAACSSRSPAVGSPTRRRTPDDPARRVRCR